MPEMLSIQGRQNVYKVRRPANNSSFRVFCPHDKKVFL